MSNEQQPTPQPTPPACSPPAAVPVMPQQVNPPGKGWSEYLSHVNPNQNTII